MSIINCQLSIVNCQLLIVNFKKSIMKEEKKKNWLQFLLQVLSALVAALSANTLIMVLSV